MSELIDQEAGLKSKQDLPQSGGTLAMGIISIVLFSGLVGLILAIITLTRYREAARSYALTPDYYTESSFKRFKAARVCAIVSLSMLGTFILVLLVMSAA